MVDFASQAVCLNALCDSDKLFTDTMGKTFFTNNLNMEGMGSYIKYMCSWKQIVWFDTFILDICSKKFETVEA